MSTITANIERPGPTDRWKRLTPWTAFGFVVAFLGGVLVSSPPSDTASDATWAADYSTSGKQAQALATGVFLILAAFLLMSFLTLLWARIASARRPAPTSARRPAPTSPLPLVAAGVATTCIAMGGALMGLAGGDMLLSNSPMPIPDLLRFGNDLGFVMVGIPGMLATALCIACLGVQAHSAGIFGPRLRTFSFVVAVVLLASFEFFPIVALLIWLIVVAVALLRAPTTSQV